MVVPSVSSQSDRDPQSPSSHCCARRPPEDLDPAIDPALDVPSRTCRPTSVRESPLRTGLRVRTSGRERPRRLRGRSFYPLTYRKRAVVPVAGVPLGSVSETDWLADEKDSFGSRIPAGAEGTSDGVAGYSVEPSAELASASVTFTVPTISCTRSDDTTGAFQEDGVYTLDLTTYALVETFCSSTGPAYQYLFATADGSFVESGAATSDTVVASLFQSGSDDPDGDPRPHQWRLLGCE